MRQQKSDHIIIELVFKSVSPKATATCDVNVSPFKSWMAPPANSKFSDIKTDIN